MAENKKTSFLSKFKSMKFVVTVWAMVLLTIIVVQNRVDFVQLGMILACAPMAYCYTNVKQKELFNKINDVGEHR